MKKTESLNKKNSPALVIGLVGCGAMGTQLAGYIIDRLGDYATLSYLCDRNPKHAEILQDKLKISLPVVGIPEIIKKSDLILEAASQEAVVEIVPTALASGKKVMVMSVGGLLRIPEFSMSKLKGTLYVPSGAIAGVDALIAAQKGEVRRVSITSRKPLQSLKDAPFWKTSKLNPSDITKPTVIFQGVAKEAIRAFPQNINVAAILSLAGIGPERTEVQIETSPTYTQNIHEILIEGSLGRIRTVAENIPSEGNPKTSALAVFSAMACLEKIFTPFKIGT